MSGIVKALTGILGVLAVVACLATVGIIGYTLVDSGRSNREAVEEVQHQQGPEEAVLPVPTSTPLLEESGEEKPEPTVLPTATQEHIHDYKEKVVKQATCYSAGQIEYRCECGASYYVDTLSTSHVAGDWEVVQKPTEEKQGIRIKKCIYCDEILEQENVAYKSGGNSGTEGEEGSAHIHQYTASVEREPTCTLAGLRKYTCSCGNFYTEMIHAPGHVASDWEVAEEATTTQMGTEQRTCKVCGVLLDSRPIDKLSPSASPSTSPQASAGTASTSPAASAAASASASPSATPHVHKYVSYVLKEANCTEKGIRSFVCEGCGSSYAESIELDLNNHTYRAVVIPATKTTMGYTIYTCIRCNYSYNDNYTPPLGD